MVRHFVDKVNRYVLLSCPPKKKTVSVGCPVMSKVCQETLLNDRLLFLPERICGVVRRDDDLDSTLRIAQKGFERQTPLAAEEAALVRQ